MNTKIAQVDELKGIAILLVISYHAGGIIGIGNQLHGEIGVDIFVILSGIGLSFGSAVYSNWKNYVKKRLIRIYPIYWIGLLLILAGNKYIADITLNALDFQLHFLGIHGFTNQYFFGINPSFWYISLILFLYAIFLLIKNYIIRQECE